LGYEDMQRLAGWDEMDLMTYSWKDVPPILSHLNLGRERFEARFDCSVVFVVPLFVVKYLLRRAGDFFDWKSGFFELLDDRQASSNQVVKDGAYAAYQKLDHAERTQKILQIKDLLDAPEISIDRRASLLREMGRLFDVGKDYEQALLSFGQAVSLKPNFSEAWIERGNSMRKLGRYEEARECYYQAVELKSYWQETEAVSDVERYNEIGNNHYNQKNYNAAIKAYGCAIKLNPKFVRAYYNLGNAHRRQRNHREAIAAYKQAIELHPDLMLALVMRGELYCLTQCYEEALNDFNRLLTLDPESGWIFYFRALVYIKLNQSDMAEADLQQAISTAQVIFARDSTNWKNRFNLALFYLASSNPIESQNLYSSSLDAPIGYIETALRDLNDFLHLFPDHPQAQQVKQLLQGAIEATQPNAL
jgi:tetratricopeptide (TPR) repeat protein